VNGVRHYAMLPTAIPRRLLAAATLTIAIAFAACGGGEDRLAQPLPSVAPLPSDADQIRGVAKTLLQAYADEDYARLCEQFAPGTFTQLIAAGKVESCEALFAKAPTFSAPNPQQIDRAEAHVRGDRATLVFREKGVEPYTLRRIDGRWMIANEAEVSR
jgi:hypothetical protein